MRRSDLIAARIRRVAWLAAALGGALLVSGPPPPTKAAADGGASHAGPGGSGEASLRIVTPRSAEIVAGSLPIEVSVSGPLGDRTPASIEILVDDRRVAILTAPPYRVTFDFGQSLAPRKIVARVVSGALSGRATEIRTRGFDPAKVDQVARVDLVTLYVSVRSASGRYLTDLPRESFTVREGNAVQDLVQFEVEKRPLVAALLLDSSLSMKGASIESAREAATAFVKALSPDDRATVFSFNDRVQTLIEPTTDREKLAGAIASIEAEGGTALYDAVYTAADRLSREEGRKIIILLSDGRDEASSGLEPGSLHTFEEALEKALRSEAIVFTIGSGKLVETEKDFYGRTPLKEILSRLASDSGGSFYHRQRPSQLRESYGSILEELRNQYSLAYAPKSLKADGSWHPIQVSVRETGMKVLTRRGYYAPRR